MSGSTSSSVNMYRVTPRVLRGHLIDCIYAGVVPFTKGSPGVGKSSIHRSIAEELNLCMIDWRASGADPTDISGLPTFVDGRSVFLPFRDIFPLEDDVPPINPATGEQYEGWLLFLDEVNSANRGVLAALYKLILDHMVGQCRLHPRVVICLAGNLDTDKAITNEIGTALESRVAHFELEVSHPEWMEDVAIKEGYDSRIIAYLNQYPSKLMDFDPDHDGATFCCPRTWEFMNRLLNGVSEIKDEKVSLYTGAITSGVAVDFVQFTKVFKSLVSIREILADPENTPIPGDAGAKWACISHMMEKVDEKNYEKLAKFANRFPLDFRILFFRSVNIRQPQLREHPAFARSMVDLAKYLHS